MKILFNEKMRLNRFVNILETVSVNKEYHKDESSLTVYMDIKLQKLSSNIIRLVEQEIGENISGATGEISFSLYFNKDEADITFTDLIIFTEEDTYEMVFPLNEKYKIAKEFFSHFSEGWELIKEL